LASDPRNDPQIIQRAHLQRHPDFRTLAAQDRMLAPKAGVEDGSNISGNPFNGKTNHEEAKVLANALDAKSYLETSLAFPAGHGGH